MNRKSGSVILVDFDNSGHHLLYANLISSWLEEFGFSFRTVFFNDKWLDEIAQSGFWRSKILFWKGLKAFLKAEPRDVIFFLYWNPIIRFWLPSGSRARFFPNSLLGIWMNPLGFRYPGGIRVRRATLRKYPFLQEKNLRLMLLDEGIQRMLQKKISVQLSFLPDFTNINCANDSAIIDEVRRFRQGKKLFLMIGAISETKNPSLFLQMIRSYRGSEWVFAVVGELFCDWLPDEVEVLSQVRLWSGRVSDEAEYNTLVQEADLLWGVYKNWELSSNLITKAGLLGIPIVVAKGYLAEERVLCYELGKVVAEGDVDGLVKILEERRPVVAPTGLNVRFSSDFSIEQAKKVVLKVLNENASRYRATFWGAIRLSFYGVFQMGIDIFKQIGRTMKRVIKSVIFSKKDVTPENR